MQKPPLFEKPPLIPPISTFLETPTSQKPGSKGLRNHRLHQDAHWWSESSKGRTRMVIIIQISKVPKSIRIELWEMITNVNQPGTRSRPNKSPGFQYFYVIDHTGDVTHKDDHPDLVIPYSTIFDTGLDAGTDITFSKAQLSEWALHVFLGLP
ncbi:hypothetical protein B9Z19DRAFT_1135190 [Tuber borchii]|uniref:Uncharacterized protein n=1 Tax=Tuber borchii TaxID=42251 RepID=A0A2T6ZD87_TUBBO|nr:hypothetical protein B9Z19DRAFT_1135190 [Tuber borchii]